MFQGSLIAGFIFLMGVYVNKPIAALYGVFASILAITISHLLKSEASSVDTGMLSFNAVLCAIAFAGTKHMNGFLVVVSTIITVIIDDYLIKNGVPPYTLPFVVTMWLLVWARKALVFVKKT